MEPKPLNRYGELAQAIKESRPVDPAALEREARLDRRASRIESWALKCDRAELAEHYAISLLVNMEFRRIVADQRQSLSAAKLEVLRYKAAADEAVPKLRKYLMDRRRGPQNKSDPREAERVEANALWPEARRKGWTAKQFHTAIVAAGHELPYDTARKWLTALRKTGEC